MEFYEDHRDEEFTSSQLNMLFNALRETSKANAIEIGQR